MTRDDRDQGEGRPPDDGDRDGETARGASNRGEAGSGGTGSGDTGNDDEYGGMAMNDASNGLPDDGTQGAGNDGATDDGTAHDDVFARLRAADPALGAPAPAAGVLRAKVDALIGQDAPAGSRSPGAASSGSGTTAANAPVQGADELAARRRRRQPWLAAAAVAAFLVVGGGGYAAGSNGLTLSLGGSDGAGAAPESGAEAAADAAPPMTLDMPGADAGGPERSGGTTENAGPGAGDTPAAGTFMYPAPGRTVFHPGAGLSGGTGEAEAYALDAASSYTREAAERMASALGLRTGVREEGGAWTAGPADGSAPALQVSADGRTSVWFFGDVDSWRCADGAETLTEPAEPGTAGGSDGSTGQEPGVIEPDDGAAAPDAKGGGAPPCPEGTAGAPSTPAATDELRRLMEAVGVDTSAFEFEAQASGGGTSVIAFHVLDGRRTGLQWSATVTGDGAGLRFAALDGFLAPVTELGTYPVVSEREAAGRLGDARFGAGYGDILPLAAAGREAAVAEQGGDAPASGGSGAAPDTSTSSSDVPAGPPATPVPGDAIGWPVRDVTITGAELGVAQHTLTDGAVVLIPAYELTGDGGTWSVVAVAEDGLDFASR
ncbi:hypothetical protein [Myceligenerans crystallogenes]|uniref:Uncharacterized protein n=1 Tax=Myceligenerans crystallogenes TaxID=316335 RepID=A0ABN2NAV1_9MICO